MSGPSTHLAMGRKERRRLLREFRRDTLRVVESGPVQTPDGLLPAALVDARARPYVRDLPRLHRLEGDGDNRTTWAAVLAPQGRDNLIRLDVEVKSPVRCSFRLLWDPDVHADTLWAVADSGLLGLATDPADWCAERCPLLVLEVEREYLRRFLALWTLIPHR